MLPNYVVTYSPKDTPISTKSTHLNGLYTMESLNNIADSSTATHEKLPMTPETPNTTCP